MEEPGEPKQGILASLKALLRTIAAIAENRLELFLVEVRVERLRLFELLLLTGIVIVLGLMLLLVLTLFLAILCAQSHQLGWLLVLALVYLLGTVVAYRQLRRRLLEWEPFSASLAELKKDKECLEEKR